MGQTRRLPEDSQTRLDRLARENWRTQVATAPRVDAVVEPITDSPVDLVSWVEVLTRLESVTARLENLEGVEESG